MIQGGPSGIQKACFAGHLRVGVFICFLMAIGRDRYRCMHLILVATAHVGEKVDRLSNQHIPLVSQPCRDKSRNAAAMRPPGMVELPAS